MSLLLDARKKSLQANGYAVTADELRLEDHAPETGEKSAVANHPPKAGKTARSAGQNLFGAKLSSSPPGRSLPNPKLLLALGGTILLLAAGGGYLWYINSVSATAPLNPAGAPPVRPIVQTQPATGAESASPGAAAPGTDTPGQAVPAAPFPAAAGNAAMPLRATRTSEQPLRNHGQIRIEQQETSGQPDPLLLSAYSAYQAGRLDEAQQLYLTLFRKDARNIDVLLGLATIAQQQKDSMAAAQYFTHILELDPRNAAANAGMSALGAGDENTESRLKILLREQGNAAILHFALGNLYADQSRWGEAQQAYFNAYTLEPDNAEFAFNLAVSLDYLGQKDLAIQHYRRALQLDPSHGAGFDHAQVEQRMNELNR